MKKLLIISCLISFVIGFATNRLIVHFEIKAMRAEVTATVGKVWGYNEEEAKKFMGIMGQHYCPEELAKLMADLASLTNLSENMKQLQFDERLISTVRGLAYLQTLEKDGVTALKESIIRQVRAFYEDYSYLLTEKPSNEQEKTLIGVVKRIQKELNELQPDQGSNQSIEGQPIQPPRD